MAGSAYDSVNTMIDNALGMLESLLNESRKYLLQTDMFNKYMQEFSGGVAQLLNSLMTPPIAVHDVNGKSHFIVPGERWKLFMRASFFYSDAGNEGVSEVTCTNPVTLSADTFKVSKADCIKALQNYESLYDRGIQTVMKINDMMLEIQKKNSNSEKLNGTLDILGMIKATLKEQREYISAMINGS